MAKLYFYYSTMNAGKSERGFAPAGSVHGDPDHLDADPERVELVPQSPTQVVVVEPALLVVEADPELFLVAGQLDLQRLARRLGPGRAGRFRFGGQGVGGGRLGGGGGRGLLAA